MISLPVSALVANRQPQMQLVDPAEEILAAGAHAEDSPVYGLTATRPRLVATPAEISGEFDSW